MFLSSEAKAGRMSGTNNVSGNACVSASLLAYEINGLELCELRMNCTNGVRSPESTSGILSDINHRQECLWYFCTSFTKIFYFWACIVVRAP